jgi:hypothetical protein
MKKFPNAGNYGVKLVLGLIVIALIIIFFAGKKSGKKSSKTLSCGKNLPVCEDAMNIHVTKEQPERQQKVQENCLSGIVRLPLNIRFVSDAPGWAEYWFITPNGYRVFKVGDNDVNFPKTTLPGCTFRIRGKAGMAKIQLELPRSPTPKLLPGSRASSLTAYDRNKRDEKKTKEIKEEIREIKKSKKLRKKLEKLEKELNELQK